MTHVDFITREKFITGMAELRRAFEERKINEEFPAETWEQAKETGITMAMSQEFVSSDPETLTCEIRFPIRSWQLNPNGTLHGGMIATAFDNAFGAVVIYSQASQNVYTISALVNYLKPVPHGSSFLVRTKVVSMGKNVATLTGEGFIEETGELAAISTATYRIMPAD